MSENADTKYLSPQQSDEAQRLHGKASIAGLILQSLQLQAKVKLPSVGCCHKSEACAKSCARRSVCFCSQSGGGVSIILLTLQLFETCTGDCHAK
jgi:hypothetical protein